MRYPFHGTRLDSDWQHPTLDIEYWLKQFPFDESRGEGGWIDSPNGIARVEQARRLASANGDLGPAVPTDFFIWADGRSDRPWLTQLGGRPWRPANKPWPLDRSGKPLAFLGQICFADSVQLVPFALPGDVALIFGTYGGGHASVEDDSALEWSPLKIEDPDDGLAIPPDGEIPFCYSGVIHRSVQYTDIRRFGPQFESIGYKEGGFGIGCAQVTSIGTRADLPQGWPFREGDGNTLVATLSSFYFRGEWPLVDVPIAPSKILHNGIVSRFSNDSALSFSVLDAGCIWIYRDRNGEFHLDESCA